MTSSTSHPKSRKRPASSAPINDSINDSIDFSLECPVCLDELVEPKLLLCGHNICPTCSKKIEKKDTSGRLSYECPLCQRTTAVKKSLETNYGLRDTLEKARRMKDFYDSMEAERSRVESVQTEDTNNASIVCHDCQKKCLVSDAFACTSSPCAVKKSVAFSVTNRKPPVDFTDYATGSPHELSPDLTKLSRWMEFVGASGQNRRKGAEADENTTTGPAASKDTPADPLASSSKTTPQRPELHSTHEFASPSEATFTRNYREDIDVWEVKKLCGTCACRQHREHSLQDMGVLDQSAGKVAMTRLVAVSKMKDSLTRIDKSKAALGDFFYMITTHYEKCFDDALEKLRRPERPLLRREVEALLKQTLITWRGTKAFFKDEAKLAALTEECQKRIFSSYNESLADVEKCKMAEVHSDVNKLLGVETPTVREKKDK